MKKHDGKKIDKAIDSIQERLTSYAWELKYDGLTPDAINAVKVRVVDTLGALIGGFFAEPSRIARNLAMQVPMSNGATIIGTRIKTTPDMAAFVNCTTARFPELTDNYVWPGSFGGHPSDAVSSLLSIGEYAHTSGRDFITSIVLAYEIYTRLSDIFENMGFDHAIFNCLATAVAAGTLLGLSREQLSHCISMAIVPNNVLRQVRTGHMSMFKAAASGQAARAGVFAAQMAKAGMEGPHLPFEGKSGWCDHVALKRFSLDTMGGNGLSFKINDTSIKMRPCGGLSISSALAAEKVAPVNSQEIERVTVEVYARALERAGSGEQRWNPDSRETADHSIPYLVAATLIDGILTLRSFDDAHLWSPALRDLMQKIEVIENPEFTKAFEKIPQQHRTRVTVTTRSGQKLTGVSGGEENDMGAEKSNLQITEKFRGLTEDLLGTKRIKVILDCLWRLESMDDVAVIPKDFVLD